MLVFPGLVSFGEPCFWCSLLWAKESWFVDERSFHPGVKPPVAWTSGNCPSCGPSPPPAADLVHPYLALSASLQVWPAYTPRLLARAAVFPEQTFWQLNFLPCRHHFNACLFYTWLALLPHLPGSKKMLMASQPWASCVMCFLCFPYCVPIICDIWRIPVMWTGFRP